MRKNMTSIKVLVGKKSVFVVVPYFRYFIKWHSCLRYSLFQAFSWLGRGSERTSVGKLNKRSCLHVEHPERLQACCSLILPPNVASEERRAPESEVAGTATWPPPGLWFFSCRSYFKTCSRNISNFVPRKSLLSDFQIYLSIEMSLNIV